MQTPKKALKNTDVEDDDFDQDDIEVTDSNKKFVDEDEDDLDAPLDDSVVGFDNYDDDFDDDDDY